mgnify:CR=1 FL=1
MSAAGSTETAARVAVIGGGPAGLMAATVLAEAGVRVELFDAMPSVGRKFLLAGRGGLNLTHSEPLEDFLRRYGDRAPEVRRWLELFSPADLRHWAAGLGVETFVGSSGRVFPVQFKASPLLRAWLRRLDGLGVAVHPRHRWTGFDEAGTALVRGPDGASRPVPARTNPVGAKGCGEAGCAGSLPAVMNALIDALREDGVTRLDMPATPERVWIAIREAQRRHTL